VKRIIGSSVVLSVLVLSLGSITGCPKPKPTPTPPKGSTESGSGAAASIKLTVPEKLEVGADAGSADLKVEVAREKSEDDVTVSFSGMPDGVKIADVKIAKADKSATAKVEVDRAKVKKEWSGKITADAKSGDLKDSGSTTLTIKVKDGAPPEKAKLTKVEGADGKVKQGGKVMVKLTITGEHLKEKVALKFADDKKGLTFSPDSTAMDKLTPEITVTAADDAEVGDHTITVTATSGDGVTTSGKFKVTVEKK
jgi:hypothetical protein